MAGGAIRGITVEIGGDTTKLGKAIGDSEKNARSLQVELRQVERLLKFDPTSVELLTQKQDVLKNSISETAKKLDTLKEAEAQVVAQFERGEIGEDQLRAFQREIIQTEKKLDDMTSELSATENALKNLANGTDSAEKHTKEYKESLEDAKKTISEFKDKAKETYDTINKGGDVLAGAAVAGAGFAAKLGMDFDSALATLVSRTGATKEEIDALNSSMENVYANNWGESIQDVAESMATVKTNTKLSGEELERTTEYAILLRDTFEFDVNESTRSAKMLMDQYGISAKDAYNLIVQGAQNGLDKNGDLLDTINEYGVHFEQLGLSAEDMFNMLVNGAEDGTWSVDKLGDAVKEFGIRVKDGTADDAFKALGLSAEKMKKQFGAGGEEAKDALSKVTTALFEMEDPIKQNELGVMMFGTMWEDLGVKGVQALMNTEGELSNTKTALDDVMNVQTDTLASKFSQLGRTVQSDLAIPLGEKILPVLEDIINYVINNSNQVLNILKTIGIALGTIFVINKIATFITSITTMITTFKKLNDAIKLVDSSQKLLNITQSASPWGLVALAIGTVVAALGAYALASDKSKNKTDEEMKKIDEFNQKMSEQADSYRQAEQARLENAQGIESEYGYYQRLVTELSNITDENGRVIAGYEARAATITGILSDALGQEISTDDLVAQGKQKVIDKVLELIQTKKVEAQMQAYEPAYLDALKTQEQGLKNVLEAKNNLSTANKKVSTAEKEYQEILDGGIGAFGTGEVAAYAYNDALFAAGKNVDEAKKKQSECNKAYEDAQGVYLGYQNTIQNYDGVTSAVIEGDTAKIEDALLRMTNNFVTAENGTKKSLEKQAKNATEAYNTLKKALEAGEPGVTQQMVDNAKKMVDAANAELDKLAPEGQKAGQDGGQKVADGLSSKEPNVTNAAKSMRDKTDLVWSQYSAIGMLRGSQGGQGTADGISSKTGVVKTASDGLITVADGAWTRFNPIGQTRGAEGGQGTANGISSKDGAVSTASNGLVNSANQSLNNLGRIGNENGQQGGQGVANGISSKSGSVSTSSNGLVNTAGTTWNKLGTIGNTSGQKGGQGVATGISSKGGTIKTAASTAANQGKAGFDSANTYMSGVNFAQGFINGMGSLLGGIISKAAQLANAALSALRNALGEQSPSKETKQSGIYFGQGFINGVNLIQDKLNNTIVKMVDKLKLIVNGAKGLEISRRRSVWSLKVGESLVTGLSNGITDASNKVVEALDGLITDTRTETQKVVDEMNKPLLEAEQKYTDESIRLKDSKKEADQKYLEELRATAEKERQIYDAQQRDLEIAKSKIVNVYKSIASEAFGYIENLEEAQKGFKEKLDNYEEIFVQKSMEHKGETLTWWEIADPAEQTKHLNEYADVLLALKDRFAEQMPVEFFNLIRDMDVDQGRMFTKQLLQMSDETFNSYIANWKEKQATTDRISKMFYEDDSRELAKVITEQLSGIDSQFYEIGEESGVQFEEGFVNSLKGLMENLIIQTQTMLTGSPLKQFIIPGIDDVPIETIQPDPVVMEAEVAGTPFNELSVQNFSNMSKSLDGIVSTLSDLKVKQLSADAKNLSNTVISILDKLDGIQVVLDSGALVGELIDKIDSALGDKQLMSLRGV